jgi:hypothetical protein
MNTIKSIKLKNYHLFFLHELLSRPLSPVDARTRNQFFLLTKQRGEEIEKERARIIKDSKPEDADNLFTEIMKEEYIIDVLPSTEKILNRIKELLEQTTKELNIQEGALYDEVMNAFEN